jgi:hypothetical protein
MEAIGLRHHQQTVVKEDTAQLRGMLNQVRHLVLVEMDGAAAKPTAKKATAKAAAPAEKKAASTEAAAKPAAKAKPKAAAAKPAAKAKPKAAEAKPAAKAKPKTAEAEAGDGDAPAKEKE